MTTSSPIASPTTAATRASKRGLIVHDSLIFLALTGVSITLFLITLGLFRSFEDHREALGREWAARGRLALQQGHPAQAVSALRTALTFHSDFADQLLLAQALADAGHTEEATNYFLNLRETRPGDSLINLQLARLRRKQGDAGQAIDFYRSAIFGNWEGDAVQRRPEVRLELAGYLAQRGNNAAARDEVLIAAGNVRETPASDALFADRLNSFGDEGDAFGFYKKSLALNPHQPDTLAKAGRLAYALGQYPEAYKLLTAALTPPAHRAGAPAAPPSPDEAELATLAANAHRLPELNLSRDLPAAERASHILLAAGIAQQRLLACGVLPTPAPAKARPHGPGRDTAPGQASAPTPATPAPALLALQARWSAVAPQLKQRILERDAALEDTVTQLIFDTETGAVPSCGPPHGDDALLLKLASASTAAAPQ